MKTISLLCVVAVMGMAPPGDVEDEATVLRGAVVVPAAWGVADLTVTVQVVGPGPMVERRFRAVEPLQRDERGDVVLEWELESAGSPRACFLSARSGAGRVDEGEMPPFGALVEAGANGLHVLEVPPPATVELCAVDDRTGAPLPFRVLSFSSAYETGLVGSPARVSVASEVGPSGEPTGAFRFRAHHGAIRVGTSFLDPAQRLQEVVNPVLVLGRRASRHLVRCRPSCGYVVVLRDGADVVDVELGWGALGRQVDGVGEVERFSLDGSRHRFLTTFPGRYRFQVPRVEGYAPIPGQEVLVHAGELTEHVIQLERR